MTRRVTVSLPDDIAAYLDGKDNASATVAAALQAHMNAGAATEAILRAIGFDITEEGKARARRELRPFTREERAEIARRRDLLRAGAWPSNPPVEPE